VEINLNIGDKEITMPEKLDRCVADVKAKGGVDNPWAVCNASLNEEVAEAIGVSESHNPIDIPFGYEVNETHSIGSGLSGTHIKVDNSHSGKKKLDRMSELVVKQLLETQIGECSCKNKSRRKA